MHRSDPRVCSKAENHYLSCSLFGVLTLELFVLIAVLLVLYVVIKATSTSNKVKSKASVERQRQASRRVNDLEVSKRQQVEDARNRKKESDRQRWEETDRQRKVEEAKQHEVEAARKKKEDDERELAAEKLTKKFTSLKANLPFYISNRTPSAELSDHDKKMWEDVTKLVQEQDSKQATLYFVKIRSLLDDNEYYKIGITAAGVKARFQKSTQVELLETVCSFDTELWKAAYLEYHFLREFRLYDGLASSLGELRPEVAFSGYTEVVRSNSVNKISTFFGELDVYNELS